MTTEQIIQLTSLVLIFGVGSFMGYVLNLKAYAIRHMVEFTAEASFVVGFLVWIVSGPALIAMGLCASCVFSIGVAISFALTYHRRPVFIAVNPVPERSVPYARIITRPGHIIDEEVKRRLLEEMAAGPSTWEPPPNLAPGECQKDATFGRRQPRASDSVRLIARH